MKSDRALASQTAKPSANTFRPYLPATLLETAARKEQGTWWEWLDGSLMHCDISGFTAMSERLAGLGKEGAELMVEVLNRFFNSMLGIATRYSGVQMKFGGDAMLLYFGGKGHADRAAACGLAMQEAMAPFAEVSAGGQKHVLRMRAGINSGRFFSASAGDPERLLHYVLTGPEVNKAEYVEEQAGLGEVFASDVTVQLLERSSAEQARPDLWRVRGGMPLARSSVPKVTAPHLIDKYLAQSVRDGRTAGPGEHRRVTAVFINVLGMNSITSTSGEDAALAAVSGLVTALNDSLQRHGGYLLGSDVAEEGDKFIALFGAPIANVDQEAAAMRFSLDVRDALRKAKSHLQVRIGVNTAWVFAGEVGWRHRREYTVIGDGVNLAARLMSAAKVGEVIVSRATADAAKGGFYTQKLKAVMVKGKSQPIEIRRLVREQGDRAAVTGFPLVGREKEMATLMRALRSTERGGSRYVHIQGEPGIGKSRLSSEVAGRARDRDLRVMIVAFHSHTSGTPFSGWRAMPLESAGPDKVRHLIDAVGEGGDDPRARREAAISNLSSYVLERSPALLVIEDQHWADESSALVIERVVSARAPGLMVCSTSREAAFTGLKPDAVIELEELPQEAAAELLEVLGANDANRGAILGRARGNPLFIVEIAKAADVASGVPNTLNDLMTLRIDSLHPDERQVLRVAAIVGQRFNGAHVQELSLPIPRDQTARILPELSARGFTEAEEEGRTYAFTHALLSDVAYESAPFALRRRIHGREGVMLEEEHRGKEEGESEVLLHHFERAGHSGKTVKYAAMAGDRSARVFANAEALSYYERGLATAGLNQRPADLSLLLERKGDVLESSGRHHEAAETLERSLRTFMDAPRTRPKFVAGVLSGRESSLCQKTAAATEHASNYDTALRLLERGRRALPPRSSRLRAKVYATTCGVLFRKGQYAEAIGWGSRAIQAARSGGDLRLVAYAQNMMATALIEVGRLRDAVRYLRQAVKTYHELGDFAGQASSNNNLGSTYQLLGMYDAALYYYGVALTADERTGDEIDSAIVHNNMAETLLLMDREDEAIQRLQEVLRIASSEPDLVDLEGWAHVTTARCYRAKGEAPAAANHLRTGTRLLRTVGATGLLTEALVDTAEQALLEGNPRLALRRARAAFRRATEAASRLAQARAQRVTGECLLELGETADGEQWLSEALDGCRRVAAEHEGARASMALARQYLRRGKRGSARSLLRKAVRVYSRSGAVKQAALAEGLLKEAEA